MRRASTAQQVAEALRRLILSGALEPGTYLREMNLAESLSVSRNTVREAIQLLVGEGLITRELHRGAYVTRLTAEEVTDVFYVRRIAELAAVESLMRRTSFPLLDEAIDGLKIAVGVDDKAGIVEGDLAFHRGLIQLAGSRRLEMIFSSLEAETRLCIALIDNAYPDPSALIAEHKGILEHIRRKDADDARRALSEHLIDAEERVVQLLKEKEGAVTR